jgi:hypothetical protein
VVLSSSTSEPVNSEIDVMVGKKLQSCTGPQCLHKPTHMYPPSWYLESSTTSYIHKLFAESHYRILGMCLLIPGFLQCTSLSLINRNFCIVYHTRILNSILYSYIHIYTYMHIRKKTVFTLYIISWWCRQRGRERESEREKERSSEVLNCNSELTQPVAREDCIT